MVRAIKTIQKTLVLAVLLAGFTSVAQAQVSSQSYDNGTIEGGGGGGSFTWPWGLEIPFPWKDIQGIWRADSSGASYYFAFRRVSDSYENRLVVKQFDYTSCSLSATGVGFESMKSVVAQMNTTGGDVYRLALSAFNPQDIPGNSSMDTSRLAGDHVMVMQISLLGSASSDWAMQMVKISSGLEFTCNDPDKKLKF